MKTWFSLLIMATAVLLTSCESTLVVKRLKVTDKSSANRGVPFYLPRQDFVVTEFGLDKKNNPVQDKPLQVSLITRPDPGRAFLVKNSPAIFSASEFSIMRDSHGRITSVSAVSDEKALETIQALASLVVEVAGVAALHVKTKEALQEELDLQKATEKNLIDQLKTAVDPAKVKEIQEALTLTRAAIKELEDEIEQNEAKLAALNAALFLQEKLDAQETAEKNLIDKLKAEKDTAKVKEIQETLALTRAAIKEIKSALRPKKTKGVRASGIYPIEIELVSSEKVARDNSKRLGLNDVKVFLVPVDQ